MTPVYFLSLLGVVYGGLIIDIDVSTDPPFIDVRNSISTLISDVERVTFGIQDEKLKKAVAKYTNDSTEPDYVYVQKTGEKHDLYAKFELQEIKRTVKPKYVDADILKGKPCDLISNKTTEIRTDWNITGTLTIADNIKHIVYFDRENKTEVSTAWGVGVTEAIVLPGDHVELCKMTVTMEYEITIAGDVVAAYTKPRKSEDGTDHRYYAYDVSKVQKAARLPTSVIVYETINVIYPKKKNT